MKAAANSIVVLLRLEMICHTPFIALRISAKALTTYLAGGICGNIMIDSSFVKIYE